MVQRPTLFHFVCYASFVLSVLHDVTLFFGTLPLLRRRLSRIDAALSGREFGLLERIARHCELSGSLDGQRSHVFGTG
jgi:hypothetical protein